MEKMTQKEIVENAHRQIRIAENAYYDKVQAIAINRDQAVAPYRKAINDIVKKYETKIYDKAEGEGRVPVSRWGVAWPHSSCQLNSLGIILYWENDDGPDDYYEMSWEEIEKEFGC